jgi:hypothetical protein
MAGRCLSLRAVTAGLGIGLTVAFGGIARADEVQLLNIRVGRHLNYTRVVLDLDRAGSFELTDDSANGRLVIATPVKLTRQLVPRLPRNADIVTGIVAEPSGAGTRIAIVTDGPAMHYDFSLPPDSDGGHRLVFDIERRPVDGPWIGPLPPDLKSAE